jgi:hypothetical protein
LKTVAIVRLSSLDARALADYFAAGPACPCIITDGVSAWPAREKWTFEYFASNYGDALGLATMSFDNSASGKATRLSDFIAYLDKPFAEIPGFWVGADGIPIASEPDIDETEVWSFGWRPFKNHKSLLDDISPFPVYVPNMVPGLSPGLFDALQYISSADFYSLFISRKDTITRLHSDFHHTIGCLVQFQGTKKVVLFAPDDYRESGGAHFNPERPNFEFHPEMARKTAYSGILAPGEMLIIPPDWWHYVRSEAPSITLSHNFFNTRNFPAYMQCLIDDFCKRGIKPKFLEKVKALVNQTPGSIA